MVIKLKQVRWSKMMSRRELSRKSGISNAAIWRLESEPSGSVMVSTLVRLARALDVKVDELIDFEEDEPVGLNTREDTDGNEN